jgi:hypothetical protein
MAKNKPGLPDGFEINLDSPAHLGDYLDEDFSGNAARVLAAKRAQAPKPAPQVVAPAPVPTPTPRPPAPERILPPPAPQPQLPPRNEQVLDLAEARRRSAPKASTFRRPERMQFNMRPETVKMFGEIVEFVQRYSLQNDAKASEIFDAVISILHEAKADMDFADVPRRGKWGTPTARAFPTALGHAFARAVALRFAKQHSESN